ncbi:hypothetical protein [Nodosilinea nodulosa]|uniref:hypothetical protein n=1 Tax=Nodosilinea nodulosa TaxID=416001 RepID=UPI00030981F4|nr:hypothetical protein [Nodosilinea nodulosa]
MAQLLRSVRINRLVIAVIFTVLVADTAPHPSLGPGLIQTEISQLQQALRR